MTEQFSGFSRSWMLMSNFVMFFSWASVLRIFYRQFHALQDDSLAVCADKLLPALATAVVASFLEFFNASAGLTRSNPLFVLLFAVVRASVELLAAPLLPTCSHPIHLFTAFCWSLGDTIRFGCFLLDILVPNARLAKMIRYTVGPILFPFGAAGEMLLVGSVAYYRGWKALYVVAALWPAGFYPLMKQLLRQRRKFFATKEGAKIKAV